MKAGVIAFPLDRPVRGGIERYLYRLAREFGTGPRRDEFVWIHGSPFPKESELFGAREVLLPERGLAAAFKRRRWSRLNSQGLTVLWGPYFGVLPGPFERVMTVHDLYEFTVRDTAFVSNTKFRLATSWMVHASDWILADSEASRRQVMELFEFPADRIVTVHLGVDTPPPAGPKLREANRRAVRERLGLPVHSKIVLFVGAFIARKNPEGLLRAFGSVAKDEPGAYLLYFGSGCEGVPGHPEVQRLKLNGRVLSSPSLDDAFLEMCYGAADVFVMPSKFEGFGLPALEAMARGVPTVLSRGGALVEIGEGAALMVDRSDEAGLAEAIARVLHDPAEARGLRERGLERAATFTWAKCATETLAVLDRASQGA